MIEFLQTILPKPLPFLGKLQETPSYLVLLSAEKEQFTGKILFEHETRKKKVYFHHGKIVLARSNLVAESLSTIFFKYILPPNLVHKIQAELSVESKGEISESKLIRNLTSNHHCNAEQIEQAQAIQREEILLNLLGWFEGSYKLEATAPKHQADHPVLIHEWLTQIFQCAEHGRQTKFHLNEGNEIQPSGDLRVLGGPQFLLKVMKQRTEGQVLLEKAGKRKLAILQAGKISTISSTHTNETLAEVLKRFRYLAPIDIKEAKQEAEKNNKRFREVLIQKRLLKDEEIVEAIQILHFERILEILSWRSGKYSIQGDLSLTTKLPILVMTEKSHTLSKENIASLKKDLGDSFLIKSSDEEISNVTCGGIVFWIQQNQTSKEWVQSSFAKLPPLLQQQASFIFEEEKPRFKWRRFLPM